MKAYWLENNTPISAQELKVHGVDYTRLDLNTYQTDLDRIKKGQGYIAQDVVEIKPDTPNLDMILAKFDKEHVHSDDEVRYVLDGSGIFDIRSNDDQWMRVEVYTGDYISVPAHRNHRFFVTADKKIRCVRLFKDTNGWTPVYRSQRQAALV